MSLIQRNLEIRSQAAGAQKATDIGSVTYDLGSELHIWIVKSSEEHGVMHLYQLWPW